MNQDSESPASTAGTAEPGKRASRRSRVLKRGYLSMDSGFTTIPCIIRNQSKTGARIELDSITPIEKRFWLHIEIDGTKVECKPVWIKGLVIGAEFVGAVEASRFIKSQTVGTSENALSSRYRTAHDIASSLPAMEQEPVSEMRSPHASKAKASFGKRK
jgi:hypothetical protein